MGGAMILLSLALSTLLWADLNNPYVWTVLFVTAGYGSIGFGRLPESKPAEPKGPE